jgi:hypothetical protein
LFDITDGVVWKPDLYVARKRAVARSVLVVAEG